MLPLSHAFSLSLSLSLSLQLNYLELVVVECVWKEMEEGERVSECGATLRRVADRTLKDEGSFSALIVVLGASSTNTVEHA